MISLAVVIVSSSRLEPLRGALRSLEACRLPEGFLELVVVESGTTPCAREVVERCSPALKQRYLFNDSPAKCAALNLALRSVRADFVVFFDDDVQIAPDVLVAYAAAASRFGRRHYFGGPTGVIYEAPPPEWLRGFLPASARGLDRGREVIVAPNLHFLGFNWAAWKSDIDELGGFNENLGPGAWTDTTGDETELQARMMKAGFPSVYLPESRVDHLVPKDSCSEAWALDRRRRMETANAILSEWQPFGMGAVRCFARLARLFLMSLVALVTWKRAWRFRAAYEWQAIRGHAKGVYLNTKAILSRRPLLLESRLPKGSWRAQPTA